MARKNIFEILSNNEIDVLKEINKISNLLNNEKIVSYYDEYGREHKITILQYLEIERIFLNWQYRKTYLTINEMINDICVDKTPKSDEEIITYMEFVINILTLFDNNHVSGYKVDKDILKALADNVMYVLEFLNLKPIEKDKDIYILVEKNSSVTAVSEIIEDKNLSFQIVEYNHYLLKGNLKKKKDILLSLADKLEPKRKVLSNINSNLENNLFYLFNNCCIRHNNKEKGKHFKKYMSKISDSELENIYDETYQMVLLAFLLLDNIERQKHIESLKDNINRLEQ